jgi:peptidoglycan/xylan/chitin deacetylase (PgdA/CDA1 family)
MRPGRPLLRLAGWDSARVVAHRHELSQRVLALTFDDGPSQWTGPILDALARAGCRATFFVLGGAIEGRESTLIRMRDEGHEIGNHSRTHPRLDELGRREIRAELAFTNEAIETVVGRPPHLFRPPYLIGSRTASRVAAKLGLDAVVFGSLMDDWALESPAEISSRVLAEARPGSIVILHDGRPAGEGPGRSREDRQPTVEAVELLLPELLERGFELLTVSELLAG